MSEKLTMPKNVQAFVNKYGRIGSKEQDATFWKEFRKAANAYADVQAKRICDLEHDFTTATEQRDRLAEEIEQLKSQLTQTQGTVTISRNGYVQELEQQRDEAVNNYETAQLLSVRVGEERDRLMFSMKEIYNISSFDYDTMPEAARRLYHGIVLEIADKARKHLTSNKI
jgi:small-conductance mechanosensitive channel